MVVGNLLVFSLTIVWSYMSPYYAYFVIRITGVEVKVAIKILIWYFKFSLQLSSILVKYVLKITNVYSLEKN